MARVRLLAWCTSLVLLGAASTAHAAMDPGVEDDFESGTLMITDAPPGQWNGRTLGAIDVSLAPSTVAPHRGSYGLRMVDNDTAYNGLVEVKRSLGPSAPADLYARFWMRVVATTPGTQMAFAVFSSTQPGGSPLAQVVLGPTGEVHLGSNDAAPGSWLDPTGFTPGIRAWHLYEFSAVGIGTATGSASLFIDGALAATRAHNWTGWSPLEFVLGERWVTAEWMGTLDFDDARIDSVPLPEQLELVTSSLAYDLGDCVPVTLQFEPSSGYAPTAPYDVVVKITDAVNGFSLDSTCSTPLNFPTIPKGGTSVLVYWRAAATGPQILFASHTDFLLGTKRLTVGQPSDAGSDGGDGGSFVDAGVEADAGSQPDAGSQTDAGPAPILDPGSDPRGIDRARLALAVGCDCNTAGVEGVAVWACILLSWLAVRRR